MEIQQKVLLVDVNTGFYRLNRYDIKSFFGPVDLGLHLAGRFNSLNIGTGLLAGSIFNGSNRLIFSGFSPCWGGFYISSMGGAGLIFDNLGINMVTIVGRAETPSVLYLNRTHGEEIEVRVEPIDVNNIWNKGRGGIYSLMDHIYDQYGEYYKNNPRILAVGPAALRTDFGAIGSVPVIKGKLSFIDTWAGRGGLGSKMIREHGIAAVIYGGTFIDEDFRNRQVADTWFQNKYNINLAAKDFDATTKYRFDSKLGTGGTFGVNYASVSGRIIAFNYNTIYMEENERLDIHEKFIKGHYLKQFNEETIKTKQHKNCGEPCVAVCKKMFNEFKKDFEPYQTLGPLCGIFDQRAAEKLNHHADMYGFDAISAGGVLSWLMECFSKKLLKPADLGVSDYPVFSTEGFSIESDSKHNAEIGVQLLDNIIKQDGKIDLSKGARDFAHRLALRNNKKILDLFLFNAFGGHGWSVPNQYWTPGVLSPMAIMGKYYMYYGNDFFPPRELGRKNAERFRQELILDNLGFCRFHRSWAEDMIPEIMAQIYGLKKNYLKKITTTATHINSRNASVFWESERNFDFIYTFLKRQYEVEENRDKELANWLRLFKKDKKEASLAYWYDIHMGIHESLRQF